MSERNSMDWSEAFRRADHTTEDRVIYFGEQRIIGLLLNAVHGAEALETLTEKNVSDLTDAEKKVLDGLYFRAVVAIEEILGDVGILQLNAEMRIVRISDREDQLKAAMRDAGLIPLGAVAG